MGTVSFVKLGGSLITDKRREKQARAEVIERLAGEIAELRRAGGAWVVGHGSGSFGHVEAERHEIHTGLHSAAQLPGLAATADEAARLHRRVIRELRDAGESPYSFAPSTGVIASGGRPTEIHLEPLRRALDSGLLPVVYGDVVMDRVRGCSICSTETLFVALIAALQERGRSVDQVYWLGETEGVYDSRGATIAAIDSTDDSILDRVAGADGTDVTGGMRHRVETALELARRGVGSWIGSGLEPGRLRSAAAGEPVPGTRIRALPPDLG